MLNKLGMSDLDDEEEEEEEDDDSWLTDTKKEKQGTVKRGVQVNLPHLIFFRETLKIACVDRLPF